MIPRRHLYVVLALALFACGDQKLSPDAGSGICSDGIDNDGDGLIDYPADFGCENEADDSEENTAPQCSDHRDNDGDGKMDFPEDPGCVAPNADDETDDCPSGPGCPECSDGKDNDFNGQTDWPADSGGCMSAGDPIEFTNNSTACGAGLTIDQLPVTGNYTGMIPAGSTTNLTTTCGVAANAPAHAFVFHVAAPSVLIASTEDPMTNFDTVLDLRSAMCSDTGAELACHDNISTSNKKSTITRELAPGNYYIIVSGKSATDTGTFALKTQLYKAENEQCTSTPECAPGFVCRIPKGGTSMVCTDPVCNDGRDDDDDGKIDFPADPGCVSPTDDTETDVCATTPTDPACPLCANGIDDDGDGQIDYPDDPSCIAASTPAETCVQSEPIIVATSSPVTGTTVGAVNDFMPPAGDFNSHLCTTSGGSTAPDVAVQLDLPATSQLSLTLGPVGYDSAQILLDSSCGGTPIECYDNPTGMTNLSNLAAGQYFLMIDGWSTGSGTFTLNISGTIKNGESCESPLAQSGALRCGTGYVCGGPMGTRTCVPTQCNDGIDNNMDGKMDFPADPGCTSVTDTAENTVCPGATCPACADGIDNDGDSLIDFPMDTGCFSAAQPNEGCRETEALVPITAPTTMGTTVGATDDHNPSCVSSDQPDRVYTLDVPFLQTLTMDTRGSVTDMVLSFMNNTCAEPSIACNDDDGGAGAALITRTNVPAGSYTIAVDAATATQGSYLLNVKGTVPTGASCEGPLFNSGVLSCPPGFGCNGTPGSRTCASAPQCFDGIDNNMDGLVDFPNDPGCTSPQDPSENTVCPGASCPACADGMDNDMDGATDYPADTGCSSAAGTSEGCAEPDTFGAILMPTTNGTLVGTADNHQPSCTTRSGADGAFSLTVPRLESLTIDTRGSEVDTVLSFMTSACSEPSIACDNDTAGSGDSEIKRQFVQAGTYTVMIDSDGATPDTFILNVKGTIVPGESCESPLFATGVLRCSAGFYCDGPVGLRTCRLAQCFDGLDNNGDGAIDYPADPGCTSFSDTMEDTVCPGPSCPVCSDGSDNDGDGTTDYPADPGCTSASTSTEACAAQTEPVATITSMVTTGTTAGQSNDFRPSCSSSSHSAPDVALQITVPNMASLNFNLTTTGGWDAAQTLLDASCGTTELGCSDPDAFSRSSVPAGTYYLVIDGWGSGNGAWSLSTSGQVAPHGSCEGALFQAGVFTCTTGYSCNGPMGSRICTTGQACDDGMDNDGDGKADFPNDPGCDSVTDNDESDDCYPVVGPMCPACSNGLDDDNDFVTDYPADNGCHSASGFSESFCPEEVDVGGIIQNPVTTGTFVGKANNFPSQSCQSNTAADVSYSLVLPVPVASLTIDTDGSASSDTVLSFRTDSCATPDIECDDDDGSGNLSMITRTNVAAGSYAIIVDAWASASVIGAFNLNVHGTVAAGTACTSPLFTTGVLACPSGTACTAGTCQ